MHTPIDNGFKTRNLHMTSNTEYKRAIRKMCLYCMNGSSKEIRECSSKECPLRKYRNEN